MLTEISKIKLSVSLLLILVTFSWTEAQNPVLGMLDAFARARNAIRLLELDVVLLNLPYGERDVNGVTFTLFTIKGPEEGQELRINDSLSVRRSNFDPRKKTKVLIHGYTQSLYSLDFPQNIKNAYMSRDKKKSFNVICVDWSVLSKEVIYSDSANYTKVAGERTAEFLIFLKSKKFIKKFGDLHLIGFSLGAHVSGVVGENIYQFTNGIDKIGRITGLDPAGPGFGAVPRSDRLDKEDAEFVDIINSNMGSIFTGDLGSMIFHGHVGFYPNGGRRQPSCAYSIFQEYSLPRRSSCSHLKSAEYYLNSIKSGNRYLATKCENWEIYLKGKCTENETLVEIANNQTTFMGEDCSREARGKYYLIAE